MSRLVVSNLSINRAELPVVSSVDLVAESGAISVVLGANGAGKTTLLEGLSGIIPVAGGSIAIDGREIQKARPAVVLLDEPAAGQSHEESVRLGQRIAEIPKLFGSAVLLVEHDMDLVRAVCSEVTVLDFGRVIASGPPAKVLDQGSVKKAYLGIEEESVAA